VTRFKRRDADIRPHEGAHGGPTAAGCLVERGQSNDAEKSGSREKAGPRELTQAANSRITDKMHREPTWSGLPARLVANCTNNPVRCHLGL